MEASQTPPEPPKPAEAAEPAKAPEPAEKPAEGEGGVIVGDPGFSEENTPKD